MNNDNDEPDAYDDDYNYEDENEYQNNEMIKIEPKTDQIKNNKQNEIQISHLQTLSEKTQSLVFMYKNDIMKERNRIINEGMDFLNKSRDETILILRYYKWAFDKLKSFFYDDVVTNVVLSGLALSEQTLEQLKKEKVIHRNHCLICNVENKNEFDSLGCKHQFCNTCWKEYLNEKAKSCNDVLQITCPQKGCPLKEDEGLFEKYFNYEIKALYNTAIFYDFISHSKYIQKCPNYSCRFYIKTYDYLPLETEIDCSCGISFCFTCEQNNHQPCSCYINSQWKIQQDALNADYLWIKANNNYRLCPICNQG